MKIIKESRKSNELAQRARKHKRKNKGMSPFSSLNPDAGNVEYNNAVFNSGFANSGESSGEGLASVGMSVSEALEILNRPHKTIKRRKINSINYKQHI